MSVSLDLVDTPEDAMRQSFDDEKMQELIDSIRAHGVIQPVALVRTGDRFRVAAGHRRSVAAVHAGLDVIPAQVYPQGTPMEEAIKNHENAFREDVNPADEALYFKRLLDAHCEGDVMRLAGLVGRKQSFVEDRLDLLRGYPDVLEALKQRRINVSAAREFNKYKDEGYMRSHLIAAIEGGA